MNSMIRESKGVYIDASCDNCEFNCGELCMGYGQTKDNQSTYGKLISELKGEFVNGCADWEISISGFIEWESNRDLQYDMAVQVYQSIIKYAKEHNIDTIGVLSETIKGDNALSKYEKETYITRLENITEKARYVLKKEGIQ